MEVYTRPYDAAQIPCSACIVKQAVRACARDMRPAQGLRPSSLSKQPATMPSTDATAWDTC